MTTACSTYYQHFNITTSGAVTHRYYVRDYLGSTRAVIDESGNVLQSTAYYPSGVPLTPNSLTPQTIKLHTGKDFFDLQGAGWYDNQARYYDCLIPTFKSQDPLAEKYPWLSPYCHCANNPINAIDPTGMDWVENNNSNEFVWIDKVTSHKNTPKGYNYVGSDTDILSYLNISTQPIQVTDYKLGISIDGEESTGLFAIIPTKTNLDYNITIIPNISSCPNKSSSNNKNGKFFNGVSVKCVLTQRMTSSNMDFNMLYKGTLSVSQYDNSYKSQYFSTPTNSVYYRVPGSIVTEASLFFSSKELSRKNSIHSAVISLGYTNSSIYNFPYKNSHSLMINPIIKPLK